MINIRQGEDLILEIIVYDNDNQKINLTGYTKIRVGLIIKDQIVYKYMDTELESILPGYGEVFVDNADSSKLNLYLTREQSATFPIGELSASVLIEYPDTELEAIANEYQYIIGNVYKGYLKTE
jgi:hypothetical protein